MNLLDEDYAPKDDSKTMRLVRNTLIILTLIVIVIIGIIAYMKYIQGKELKVYLNGKQDNSVKELLVFENDDNIYVPIRAISSSLGYSCYNGSYLNKSEDASKCYVECKGEIVDLNLNSNKIYKLNLSSNNNNYTYIYMDKPVKAINGELYITTDGMQKVFNTYFDYDQNKNVISIYPEAHVWPYYSKIRNFSSTSFKYPVKLNKPVFVFTTTYKKRKYRRPKIIVYIDGPFYSDQKLSLKKSQEELRNKVYNTMCLRSKNTDVEYYKYIKDESND